jgi:hypothetical protein
VKLTAIAHGLDLSLPHDQLAVHAVASMTKRSPGRHMSELYGSYYAKTQPKRYAKKQEDTPPHERWGVGMAFEEMLELGLKARVKTQTTEEIIRPGEFETAHTEDCTRAKKQRTKGCGCRCGGGVLFSPDLTIFNGVDRTGEIKLHTMSHKGAPHKVGSSYAGLDPKFDKFFTQLKVYNHHLSTPYARLYSFSMREMVHFNEPKILLAWDITFTEHELWEEWELLRRHGIAEGLLT